MAITDEKYVLLTTFRKNGEGVGTPVWIVALPDGTGGFTTEIDSGKVKRVRNNPSVTLQPCNLRGKVTADSEMVTATADVLLGADARAVTKAVRRKYRVAILLLDVGTLFRRLLRRPEAEECAIRLRFE
ncbi:MAG: PPOX class F420-dependent oxidoreductase [Ilumatobacteraceae bacterium]|nr:PPOX class F420-dependent oxidoreductase [Ilumatobacteraceae bacterium]